MYHMRSVNNGALWSSKQSSGVVGNSGNSKNNSWEQHKWLILKEWNSGNSGNSKFSIYKTVLHQKTAAGTRARARIVKNTVPTVPTVPKYKQILNIIIIINSYKIRKVNIWEHYLPDLGTLTPCLGTAKPES